MKDGELRTENWELRTLHERTLNERTLNERTKDAGGNQARKSVKTENLNNTILIYVHSTRTCNTQLRASG